MVLHLSLGGTEKGVDRAWIRQLSKKDTSAERCGGSSCVTETCHEKEGEGPDKSMALT